MERILNINVKQELLIELQTLKPNKLLYDLVTLIPVSAVTFFFLLQMTIR